MSQDEEKARTQAPIDLNNPPPGQKWFLGLEKDEHPADGNMRRIREVLLLVVALGILGMIGVYTWETLHSAAASADAQKWAFGTLTAIGGSVVTYLFKK